MSTTSNTSEKTYGPAGGNLFIKNLDKSIDDKELHDTFSKFGIILSCKVAVDVNGISRGHGFVQFENESSAKAAILNRNGKIVKDRPLIVSVFIPRKERDHYQLQSQQNTSSQSTLDVPELAGLNGPNSYTGFRQPGNEMRFPRQQGPRAQLQRQHRPYSPQFHPSHNYGEMEDSKLCIICLDKETNCIVLPCAHYAYCEDCVESLDDCAICRSDITEYKKVFEP